ncbi:hypothetical protein KM043_009583 [Ampulex compressa]|nr:hypothetical protein KM043_009583 [Ampulex compressa]
MRHPPYALAKYKQDPASRNASRRRTTAEEEERGDEILHLNLILPRPIPRASLFRGIEFCRFRSTAGYTKMSDLRLSIRLRR